MRTTTSQASPSRSTKSADKPAAKRTTGTTTGTTTGRAPAKPDAVTLLRADHAEVKKLFKEYEKLAKAEAPADERRELALTICEMLKVHTQIEEEIFYPAARELLPEGDLVDEATVEHAGAKDLIAQIEAGNPEDPLYDAKVKVLGEQIDHHVKEEQDEMFPKVKKAGMDTKAIGEKLASRKSELMASH